MTEAKKNAERIVAEFKELLTDFDKSHANAKRCAIHCVKRMISELNRYESFPLQTKDWEETIEEIKRL